MNQQVGGRALGPAFSPALCMHAKSLQLCPTLRLWTVSLQAPLSMAILQARILVGGHAFLQGIFPNPGIEPLSLESPSSPALEGRFFTVSAPWEAPPLTHPTPKDRGSKQNTQKTTA